MQLMPGTARWVAGKLARNDFKPAHIASVELNTQFGAYYFRYWHDRLEQRPALTAAAYNAGPARAQSWRPAAVPLEGAIWVETIPFSETRDYVKKVLANTVMYARVLNEPFVSLTDRLGVVTPSRRRRSGAGRADAMRTGVAVPAPFLVLGGSGFIGRHVVARLVAAGHRVTVLTRRRASARHLILLPTVDVVEGDCIDRATVARLAVPGERGDQPGRHPARARRADRSRAFTSTCRACSWTCARRPACGASCT